jgi:hypothetical protein
MHVKADEVPKLCWVITRLAAKHSDAKVNSKLALPLTVSVSTSDSSNDRLY